MCISSTDPRRTLLETWLREDLNLPIQRLDTASSDASFRRYFRVTNASGSLVVMDAPPERENTHAFVTMANLLFDTGIHVPEIHAHHPAWGFVLMEDLGCQHFLDVLRQSPGVADHLYAAAMQDLLTLANIEVSSLDSLPRYDEAMLRRELGLFSEWLVQGLLQRNASEARLDPVVDLLVDSALQQPTVFVHRDFHSRNLMCLENGGVGVIDFQDAVVGPLTYDIVSLLRDCYIEWPDQKVSTWLREFYRQLHERFKLDADWDVFVRWFDLMGMQRHLKAAGIFARLKLRDDKPNYIADIPRTLGYVVNVARRYPELADFHQYLTTEVMPYLP